VSITDLFDKIKPDDFGGLPIRAIRDPKLSALELRTLGAIGLFDRRSRTGRGAGQGCTVKREKLALLLGCHPTSLSTAIQNLASASYINVERGQDRRCIKSLTVNYCDEAPADSLSVEKSSRVPRPRKNPAKVFSDMGNQPAEIVCQSAGDSLPANSLSDGDVSGNSSLRDIPKVGKDSVETDSIDSAEAARFGARQIHEIPVSELLARIGRALKVAPDAYPTAEWQGIIAWLEGIHGSLDRDNSERGWADRLADEITAYLEARYASADLRPPTANVVDLADHRANSGVAR
jgi:DNA-binding MarR family transcriptional regulator